ncbi:MAG: tRNA threonylcarbamoyladenosine dehydratase [Treponema sp.]|jgi:tRNA A37 threonylcarbamoyladenosine dehydratase|nr:tRNA threonylcarbamoyladenosine dehydratase [Treponema sp.]
MDTTFPGIQDHSGASPHTQVPGGEAPQFHRLGLLAGREALAALERTGVIVFGLGGVGSWAAEALVRSGIGRITVVDSDSVCVTNINRQIQALPGTVGLPKAAVLMKRLLDINPRCEVRAFNKIFSRDTAPLFEIGGAGYVIDAIDSLTSKLDLIELCAGSKPPVMRNGPAGPRLFSCMGMASRLDPARIKTADIWDTRGCPLARLVRQGLKKRGFTGKLTVVYSDEPAVRAEGAESFCGTPRCFCSAGDGWCSSKKVINGSIVTVTAAAGMILASLVINDVIRRVKEPAARHG